MRRDYRLWSPVEEVRLRDLTAAGQTIQEIAKLMGRSPASVQNKQGHLGIGRMRGLRQATPTPDAPDTEQPPTLESEPSPQPVDLPAFLAERNVDLTVWEVEKHVFNEWGQWPHLNYQLKVWLKRKPGAELEQLGAQILADIEEATKLRPRATHKPLSVPEHERHMMAVEMPDIHLGKLAHAEEVGENFDSKIAMARAKDAAADLLWQAKPYALEQIVLRFTDDLFNSDNLIGTTTGGTRQDTDTRFHLMFRRGWQLASWLIDEAAKIAPVYVPIVPGNHDRQTAFCLGAVLEAEFKRDPRVTIDNSAAVRKYFRYGANLLGFTHGDEEKPADLPQIMATEQPALWAETTHREFHLGHFHHGKEKAPVVVDDKLGVTVRWLRSLSGADRWHTGKGFLGKQGAEAFVFRKSGGLRAHLFTYPQALDRAA